MRRCALVLVLPLVACTPSPEEIAAREAKRAEHLRVLDTYVGELARVHAVLQALDLEAIAPVPCAGIDLRARAQWPDERGPLHIRILDHEFLRRFGADAAVWTKLDNRWDWITDSTLAGHFDRPLAGRPEWSLADTAERVAEMFARDPYLIVVRPLAELTVMPELAADGRSFESGYYAGWMFVVERSTAKVVCQVELEVESSELGWELGLVAQSDEDRIREDFTDNFFAAIDRGLADAPAPTTAPTAKAPTPAAPTGAVATSPAPPSDAPQVIEGDGHRYEIPADFVRIDHRGATAYRGKVRGANATAEVTNWATRESFDGDLEALTERERAAATAAGGKIPTAGLLGGGPVLLMIGDTASRTTARRMKIELADRFELRTIALYRGTAHIFHCETPNVANAWANIGSECIARSTTFRLAPGR